jgi:hypothetical protein
VSQNIYLDGRRQASNAVLRESSRFRCPPLERRTRTAATSGTNADNRPEGYISGRSVAVFNFSSSSTPQTIQSLFLLNLFTTFIPYTKINDYSSLS